MPGCGERTTLHPSRAFLFLAVVYGGRPHAESLVIPATKMLHSVQSQFSNT